MLLAAARLLGTAATALAASDPATAPVLGVLTRVIGAKSAAIFELKLNASMEQGFTLAAATPICARTQA
jgi:hypothetical protein